VKSAVAAAVQRDLWHELRSLTQARIGLPRVGNALSTSSELELRAAHELARDAVAGQCDTRALAEAISTVGMGSPTVLVSKAASRDEYLRRPDLGRQVESGSMPSASHADLGVVLADGLSPAALNLHGLPLLEAIRHEFGPTWTWATPVIALGARVGLGDQIGFALAVKTVLVIIGERPGLSVPHSLGIYITHDPRPGRTDAERNCVSNIHPPDGLGYEHAARVAAELVRGACRSGASGVHLKDRSIEDASSTPPLTT